MVLTRLIRRFTIEHHNPLLNNLKSSHKFITIGEIMLRLTPPNYQKIRMANEFEATYGGSEANIALALANLGIDSTPRNDKYNAGMAGTFPKYTLNAQLHRQ